MNITDLRTLISKRQIMWTEHLSLRLRERGIKRADVINCIQNGEIIEHYPEDKPFESCLIFGTSVSEKPLHVVAAINPNAGCCIITSYCPSTDKWESDLKTRKERK